MNRQWKGQIVVEPDLHHGEACIKGTRVPVSIIVGSLADGMSVDEILVEYPQLTVENVYATLAYVEAGT